MYVEYGSGSGSGSGSSSGSGLTGDFVEYGSGSSSGSGLTGDFFEAQAILDCLAMAMVILVIA